MVCANWRIKHSAPPVAVCQLGGAQDLPRAVVECRRLGRDSAQDRSLDPDHEEPDSCPDALEPCRLNCESQLKQFHLAYSLDLDIQGIFIVLNEHVARCIDRDRYYPHTFISFSIGMHVMAILGPFALDSVLCT